MLWSVEKRWLLLGKQVDFDGLVTGKRVIMERDSG